jgi:hypothetical protein
MNIIKCTNKKCTWWACNMPEYAFCPKCGSKAEILKKEQPFCLAKKIIPLDILPHHEGFFKEDVKTALYIVNEMLELDVIKYNLRPMHKRRMDEILKEVFGDL